MSDWLPIESAPKDGTRILAYWRFRSLDSDAIVVARWRGDEWCVVWDNEPISRIEYWQPLPPPPSV